MLRLQVIKVASLWGKADVPTMEVISIWLPLMILTKYSPLFGSMIYLLLVSSRAELMLLSPTRRGQEVGRTRASKSRSLGACRD
jgi:hypothetical protein